jgi:hypothetical protein
MRLVAARLSFMGFGLAKVELHIIRDNWLGVRS